ncbi:MAG: MDR/zinc-dependent alcohol dehydrogenase-like family protein [Candidatus Jordarchaeum sp.]|uniref:MDR/zinc-dependent alcohol dehydrogenase-like family protein n=1 Tax=Candidatus Jordarchaeum sp. TaxID=2823881 RepID=UPI00404A3002
MFVLRALLIENREIKVVEDYHKPEVKPGWVLVKPSVVGVCKTDLELVEGYMGFSGVPGHEFVGVVEESSDEKFLGKRIVGEINFACGSCEYCVMGRQRHCPNRSVLGIQNAGGAFAEYVTLPQENVHTVPKWVSDDQAVFVEPLAASLEILMQTHIKPTWKVYVLGDGKLGLLVSQVLRLTGCDLVLVGKHENKLRIAERQGVKTTTLGNLPENKADLVIECTGNPNGYNLAKRLVRSAGTIVAKSTYHQNLELNWSEIVVDEINIIGSRCGPFEPAIRLLEQGLIDTESLITAKYPFKDILKAFEHARDSEAIKILVEMEKE